MELTSDALARLGPGAREQLLRKLGQTPAAKAAKYRNKKTSVVMPNGTTRTFDSRKEAARYGELLALLRAGKIHDLRLQVDFTLQEAYVTAEGEPVRAIRYRADFTYRDAETGTEVVEDVKGVKTSDYKLKKKLMQDKFGISIKEA